MFSKRQSLKEHNEDALGFNENLWVVCDGATGLGFGDHLGLGSDAAWFSQTIVDELLATSADPSPLEKLLLQAARKAGTLFPEVPLLEQPSASIAIVRKIPGKPVYEYYVLGDCTLLIRQNGSALSITDERISAFDEYAIQVMQTLQKEQGGTFFEKRLQIGDILKSNRLKKNTDQGYWILDGTADWAGHGIQGVIPASELEAFALYSDGMAQLQKFENWNNAQFLDALQSNPQQCLDRLEYKQYQDKDAQKVPRLKIRDDISLIVSSTI